MLKRFIALCLLLLMLACFLPEISVSASAASPEQDIDAYVGKVFSDFAASNNVESGSYEATMQMLNHAINGGGKDLYMGEGDAFTAVVLNSNLGKEALTKALQTAMDELYRSHQDYMMWYGSMAWYAHKSSYSLREYSNYVDNSMLYTGLAATCKEYTGAFSSYDESILLVGGDLSTRIYFDKVSASEKEMTYNIHLRIYDNFDFNANYKSSDAGLAKAITLIGKLLAFGGAFETYHWEINLDLQLTIPNSCTHESANYRWEHNEKDFVPVEAEGCIINPLTRIQTAKTDGTLYDPYFQTSEEIRLYHDKPWVVEFTMKSSASVMLSPTSNYSSGKPYLLKTSVDFVGGYAEKYKIFDPEQDKEVTKYKRHQYGVNFKIKGYSSSKWHTYRLENHVSEDGSNMIYMYLDGELIGPMTTYYYNTSGTNDIYGENDTWLNGVDFFVNYIGNSNFRIYEKPYYGYLQIWENGENGDSFSHFQEVTQAPDCTTHGAQMVKCSICGVVKESTPIPALGHKEETIPGYSASCTAEGLTEGSRCTVCGDVLKTQNVIPALGHKEEIIPGYAATCTAAGLTDGKKCSVCGELLAAQTGIPVKGHSYVTTVTKAPTDTATGTQVTACSVCGDSYTETLPPLQTISRIYGENRYQTSFAVADQLKANLGVEKFDVIVVASGKEFPDALAGSYLANRKNAPILLVNQNLILDVKDYISRNLSEGGTVYLLGGEAAIRARMEEALEGFHVKRLAGANRYETNLKILTEAGTQDQEILICTGKGFADSLSASAVNKPILLVNKTLTAEQKEFLVKSSGKFVIIGGESVISVKLEAELMAYGSVERIGGVNRYETSVLVANRFFQNPQSAVLAYAKNFPDGLCGGPLAYSLNAPLILTADGNQTYAAGYARYCGITHGAVLGGDGLIANSTANEVFTREKA